MLTAGEAEAYARPWRKEEYSTGISIKDARGVTVVFMAFSGKSSISARRQAADLIIEAVNSYGRDAVLLLSAA